VSNDTIGIEKRIRKDAKGSGQGVSQHLPGGITNYGALIK
jgi:hypothetical protein